jgi:hypothetical protein
MSSEGGAIGENTIISYDAIVCDMGVSHDQTVVSHYGTHAIHGSLVDSNTLTNGSVVPNMSGGFFPLILEVLGDSRDDRSGENLTILPDACPLHNSNVGAYPSPFAYFYIFADSRKRFYHYILSDFGFGVYID